MTGLDSTKQLNMILILPKEAAEFKQNKQEVSHSVRLPPYGESSLVEALVDRTYPLPLSHTHITCDATKAFLAVAYKRGKM